MKTTISKSIVFVLIVAASALAVTGCTKEEQTNVTYYEYCNLTDSEVTIVSINTLHGFVMDEGTFVIGPGEVLRQFIHNGGGDNSEGMKIHKADYVKIVFDGESEVLYSRYARTKAPLNIFSLDNFRREVSGTLNKETYIYDITNLHNTLATEITPVEILLYGNM